MATEDTHRLGYQRVDVATDQLATADRLQFISTIHEAARRGQFSMRLTMFAVVATAPMPR